jgi:serralysin
MNCNSIHSAYDNPTGILDVTDTTNILFIGNYSQNSFKFPDDGDGGSIVYVQTGSSQLASPGSNASPTPVAASIGSTAGQSTFIFAPNFGQATPANFVPATNTIQIDKTLFANINALLAATHDDSHGNAVITDSAHDTITIQNVTTAQLQARQSDFLFV